jgi:2-desacetyl-2-hydroxyethyl bacteriochlorophyllide A dehydrogenase
MMQRIILEQPNQFKMVEVEAPPIKPGEALVRVRRIGICGTDLHAFRGRQPYFTYPRVLGHELSGEIVEIGDNAHGLDEGDYCVIMPYLSCGTCIACRQGKTNCCTQLKVYGVHIDGGMQAYIAMPVGNLIKSEKLTLEQMALIENQSIGAHAVRRAQIETGEYALVIGAGPIGLGVIQIAGAAGAEVIVMDIDDQKLAFCRESMKVKHTINALNDPAARLEAITAGDYPTVVFDATGSPQSMMTAFNYVAHGGRYVLVSLVKADITFYDPDFHKRELTLMSSRNATLEDFATVIRAMENGTIVTEPLITHRVPFEQMIGQFESWLKPETGVIKAMVEL